MKETFIKLACKTSKLLTITVFAIFKEQEMTNAFDTILNKLGKVLLIATLALAVSLGAAADVYSNNGGAAWEPEPGTSIEEMIYKERKACIPNTLVGEAISAVASDHHIVAGQAKLQSPKHGVYDTSLFYNRDTRSGYIMAAQENSTMMCAIEKISDFSYKQSGLFDQSVHYGPVSEDMCATIPYLFTGLCKGYNEASSKLIEKGFSVQWQANNHRGEIMTVLSRAEGSNTSPITTYLLKTDHRTNATGMAAASTNGPYIWTGQDYVEGKDVAQNDATRSQP